MPKAPGLDRPWWYSTSSMPGTDNDDYEDWGPEKYPGWMELRCNESWAMDWFYCKMCRKFMTDEHKSGERHIRKLEWWLTEKARREGGGDQTPSPLCSAPAHLFMML